MSHLKKALVVMVLALLALPLIAGCNDSGSGDTEEGTGKVTVITFVGKSSASAQTVTDLIKKMKEEFKGKVDFKDVDYDSPASKDMIKKYSVSMNPTVIVINTKGQVKEQFLGTPPEDRLQRAISSFIPGPKPASSTPGPSSSMPVQTIPVTPGGSTPPPQ